MQGQVFDARAWARAYFRLDAPEQQKTLSTYLQMGAKLSHVWGSDPSLAKLTDSAAKTAEDHVQEQLKRVLAAIPLSDAKHKTLAVAEAFITAFAAGRQLFMRHWEPEQAAGSVEDVLQALQLEIFSGLDSFIAAVVAAKSRGPDQQGSAPAPEAITAFDQVWLPKTSSPIGWHQWI